MQTATVKTFETIEPLNLASVAGGDGWSDYKATVGQSFNDTVARGRATYNDVRAGNWGSALDNAGGTAYNAMQTFNNAVGPWIPAVGGPASGRR
jgi:hypothetical protein